jgi:hypothetical protein
VDVIGWSGGDIEGVPEKEEGRRIHITYIRNRLHRGGA